MNLLNTFACICMATLTVGCASAAPYTFDDFDANYLAELVHDRASILFSECQYSHGKIVLILPLNKSSGRLVELSQDRKRSGSWLIANDATITFVPMPTVVNVLMGGSGAGELIQDSVDFLLKQSFRFATPGSISVMKKSIPTVSCPSEFD